MMFNKNNSESKKPLVFLNNAIKKKAIILLLIAFFIFAIFFSGAKALSVIVNAPNGGETWLNGTTHNIDFNFTGTNDTDDINASLYYSKTAGSRTNTIKSNLRTTDYIDVNRIDDTGVWEVFGGTLSIDSVTSKDGKSLKCISGAGVECGWRTLAGTGTDKKDLATFKDKGKFGLWLDVNRTDFPATGYQIDFGNDASRYIRFNASIIQPQITTVGWNFLSFDINSPTSSAGTIIWSDINFIAFDLYNPGKEFTMRLDKWFAYDSNCSSTNYDGNAQKNTSCLYSWTLPASSDVNNMFVDINVNDGTTTMQDSSNALFNFQGYRTTIYNEITDAVTQPDDYKIDNNSWLGYCSAGICTFDSTTNISLAYHTVTISKLGFGSRDYNVYIDVNAATDVNFALLPTLTGKTVNFQFYAPDLNTLLSNYTVFPRIKNYWAGAQTTDAQGKVSFFVDANNAESYTVDLNSAAKKYHYYNTKVTVVIPKDEETIQPITPFGLVIEGVGLRDYNGLVTQRDFNIFSNATDYYILTVNDANQNLHLQRTILLQTKGDTNFLTVEPLLPSVANGITSTIFAIDPNTKKYLQNITVKLKRDFNGTSTELFSNITDAAGTVSASMVYLRNYLAEFWNGTQFVFSGNIEAKSANYYVLLDLNFTGFDFNRVTAIDINFSGSSVIQATADGNVHFDQNISGSGLQSVAILITNGNNTVFNNTYSGVDLNFVAGHFEQNFSIHGAFPIQIDSNQSILIKITVTKTDGKTITRWKSYGVIEAGAENLKTNLQTLRTTFGDTGIQLFALFLVICAVGGLTRFLQVGGNNATIIGMAILGLFTYFGWFDTIYFLLLCLAAFVFYFLLRRDTE